MGHYLLKKQLDDGSLFVYEGGGHEIKVTKMSFKFGDRYVVLLDGKKISISSTFGPCRRKAMNFIRIHKMQLSGNQSTSVSSLLN